MRIVIAEDAAVLRDGLVELLIRRGHQVVAAVADGDALRAAVAEHHPAVGVAVVDPEVVTHLLGASRRGGALDSLTDREREVLALMAEGRSNGAIATTLFLSQGAVEKHVTSIFAKLGLPPSHDDHRRVLA